MTPFEIHLGIPMKKIMLLLLCTVFLAGCANKPYEDNLAPYRHMTAKELYMGAETDMAKGDYDTATKQLSAMDALFPFGPYAEQGQLDIIYAYYEDSDSISAEVAADRYIHLYPAGSHVDYAYYMKGLVNFHQDMTWLQRMVGTDPSMREATHLQESFASFNQLVQRFPRSVYRNDSILRMVYIRNVLANHQIDVADYYFKRKAYVAAANRADVVIQNFPKSPAVKKAVELNVAVYKKLSMPKREALYRSIYKMNF
jgi:outer membrane protein assembly factor BamD